MTRQVRGRRIGFLPQDPYPALIPVFKIGSAAARGHALACARPQLQAEAARRAALVGPLRRVQLPEPEAALERYPHRVFRGATPTPDAPRARLHGRR